MLVRLLEAQTSKYWPYIKYALKETDPLWNGQGKLNNTLEGLLAGGIHCWLNVEDHGGYEPKITTMMLTTIYDDLCTRTKGLRILVLYGFDDLMHGDHWTEGIATIVRFAKSKGCEYIDGLTNNPSIVKWCSSLNASVHMTYIRLAI